MMNFDNSPSNNETSENSLNFTYNFSSKEIKNLALFLRKNQNQIPPSLESFARQVELFIYSSMSVDEVEKFYS
jgi:hypothetical protein